jgi:hypothetical protein
MEDGWRYLEGKVRGRAYAAAVRHPLAPARWPEYDHHVAIAIDYAPHWRTGLPRHEDLTRLQDIEDRMIERLVGHGVLAATETGGGTRTIHLYVRGGGPLIDMYRRRAERGKQGGLAVAVAHDPDWRAVSHLARADAGAA